MTNASFSCHCEAYEIGRGNLKSPTIVFGNKLLRGNDKVKSSFAVLPQQFEQAFHIFWQRRFEFHHLAGGGVFELQRVGVTCTALHDRGLRGWLRRGPGTIATTITGIGIW